MSEDVFFDLFNKLKRPMKKFAVFGNPISQSLSPAIHHMFADLTGETIQYEKIEAPIEDFEDTVTNFFADERAVGCNVTVPFKERAFKLSEANCNEEAATAKAVNTLHNVDGCLHGYTTDGMGLVADLLSTTGTLSGKRILLIGAGGATRGVAGPLLRENPESLFIANRTFAKAQAIVSDIANPKFEAITADDLVSIEAHIIINCTSASLTGDLPVVSDSMFGKCELAYDMVYSSQPTRFMQYAAEKGAAGTRDGFGMLVEQAAAAFTIWTGKRPETAGVIQKLRP